MVFTFPGDAINFEGYKSRLLQIYQKVSITTTDRSKQTASVTNLPQGLLQNISFQFVMTSGASYLLKKGETYVYLFMQKIGGAGGKGPTVTLIDDYLYDAADPHWTGELPIEDGDQLQLLHFNSNPGLAFIIITGYMVKI